MYQVLSFLYISLIDLSDYNLITFSYNFVFIDVDCNELNLVGNTEQNFTMDEGTVSGKNHCLF